MKLFGITATGFVFALVFVGMFFTIIRPALERSEKAPKDVVVVQVPLTPLGTQSRLHFSEDAL